MKSNYESNSTFNRAVRSCVNEHFLKVIKKSEMTARMSVSSIHPTPIPRAGIVTDREMGCVCGKWVGPPPPLGLPLKNSQNHTSSLTSAVNKKPTDAFFYATSRTETKSRCCTTLFGENLINCPLNLESVEPSAIDAFSIHHNALDCLRSDLW